MGSMGYCEHVMEVIILFAFSFIGWNPTLTQSNLYQIIFSPKSIPCHAFKRVLGFGVGVGWAQFLGLVRFVEKTSRNCVLVDLL